MWDGISLLANQVMTMPGFFQMKFLLDAIADPNPRKAIGVAASYLNSWFNPINGGLRDMQRLGGISRDSLVVPPAPFLQKDGELLLQELGPDAPQNQVFAASSGLPMNHRLALSLGPRRSSVRVHLPGP